MTTSALPEHSRPPSWGKSIHSETNFFQISPFIYRSEQPSQTLLPLLKQHEIDVVINLRSRNQQDISVLSSQNIQISHIPIHTWALDKEDLLNVMKVIQFAKNQNKKVLIHCYHGSDRTGASIAMYRIIFENWTINNALHEMKHGGYGFHPIWINIEKIFTPDNIKWIQQQLLNPS